MCKSVSVNGSSNAALKRIHGSQVLIASSVGTLGSYSFPVLLLFTIGSFVFQNIHYFIIPSSEKSTITTYLQSSPFSDCHQDFLRWGLKVVMTFSTRWLMVLYTGSYGRLESQSKHFFSSCGRDQKSSVTSWRQGGTHGP